MHKSSLARKNADAHDALLAAAEQLGSYFDLADDVEQLRAVRPSTRQPEIGMLRQREALIVLLEHVNEKIDAQITAEIDAEKAKQSSDTKDNADSKETKAPAKPKTEKE